MIQPPTLSSHSSFYTPPVSTDPSPSAVSSTPSVSRTIRPQNQPFAAQSSIPGLSPELGLRHRAVAVSTMFPQPTAASQPVVQPTVTPVASKPTPKKQPLFVYVKTHTLCCVQWDEYKPRQQKADSCCVIL